MSQKSDRLLQDILDSISRIEETIPEYRSRDAHTSLNAYDIVRYHLTIIGEAVNHLPEEVKDREPTIPWQEIVDMRNFLIHAYAFVRRDVVSNTIEKHVPNLKAAILRLQREGK
jgi:uncharacterized protein with HEPN domain